MINFQIRYDEALARWQYQTRQGTWSRPLRLHKLAEALQAELVSFEEQAEKPSTAGHPATNPRTYTRSPLVDLQEQVYAEIAAGRVVVRKLSPNRTQAQVEELARLLDLD